jgi:hypothetical protein
VLAKAAHALPQGPWLLNLEDLVDLYTRWAQHTTSDPSLIHPDTGIGRRGTVFQTVWPVLAATLGVRGAPPATSTAQVVSRLWLTGCSNRDLLHLHAVADHCDITLPRSTAERAGPPDDLPATSQLLEAYDLLVADRPGDALMALHALFGIPPAGSTYTELETLLAAHGREIHGKNAPTMYDAHPRALPNSA